MWEVLYYITAFYTPRQGAWLILNQIEDRTVNYIDLLPKFLILGPLRNILCTQNWQFLHCSFWPTH